MAKRSMVISGYENPKDVDPLYQPLLGRFEDELDAEGKLLLELSAVRCSGDLYFATWDDEALTLTSDVGCGSPGCDVGVTLVKGMAPQAGLPALYALIAAAMG